LCYTIVKSAIRDGCDLLILLIELGMR